MSSFSEGSSGGFKEIIFTVSGEKVYGTLKYESGVHRVQRVPETESGGRIHTSTITVAIMPEAEEIDFQLDLNDCKFDVFRASGNGGQCVNTTDSAVRLTHYPTGIVIYSQTEKSQLQNKEKAFRLLRSKLYELELEKQHSAEAEATETPAAEEQTDVTETPETEGDSAKADEETADSTESEAAATPEAEK